MSRDKLFQLDQIRSKIHLLSDHFGRFVLYSLGWGSQHEDLDLDLSLATSPKGRMEFTLKTPLRNLLVYEDMGCLWFRFYARIGVPYGEIDKVSADNAKLVENLFKPSLDWLRHGMFPRNARFPEGRHYITIYRWALLGGEVAFGEDLLCLPATKIGGRGIHERSRYLVKYEAEEYEVQPYRCIKIRDHLGIDIPVKPNDENYYPH